MRRPNRWSEGTRHHGALGEDGSAALEFTVVGLLMLVPVVYLIVALGAVQGQLLGSEAGARHIARAVATAQTSAEADVRAQRILGTVAAEYGIDPASVDVALRCIDGANPCPRAGATVVVTVGTRVALPLVPPIFELDRLASIPIEASSAQKVSRFWRDG